MTNESAFCRIKIERYAAFVGNGLKCRSVTYKREISAAPLTEGNGVTVTSTASDSAPIAYQPLWTAQNPASSSKAVRPRFRRMSN
ncbi:MAG: hypothetical protein IJD01_04270 [Clostridia bacterium]|nr:hypothetical protein [Clostridia bacterium]